MNKYFAELFATFTLVLVGVGGASFVAQSEIQVALMFGLGVILLAYGFGHISGGHANPSITIGHLLANKISLKDAVFYILFQIIGAVIGGYVLYTIMNTGQNDITNLATNQVQENATILQAALVEFFITFIFVTIILQVTSSKANLGKLAPIFIAITLGIMVTLALDVTNGSLNFARSLSVAFYNQDALNSLWIFLVFPTLGGAVAGLFDKYILSKQTEEVES